jgi:DUF4097 and DUF4098 domain-containing protein YvlB
MKTLIVTLACIITTMTNAQQFSEKINKEFTFEKKSADNAIIVANINGNIKVTGYEGEKIIVEVNRQIFGKTEARLQKGKEELQLGILDRADTIIFYVQEGCNKFGQKVKGSKNNNGWDRNGWGYNWDCKDRDCQPQYDYKLDFTIKVPAGIHVSLSTINEGDIVVENVKGTVDANNINGSIKLSNLVREADASTINGDVDIEYTVNPSKDCRFYTLNGDINAVFQKGLAASLSFESFNGSFYTNMDNLTKLPAQVVKSSKGEGIKYKVTGNRYKIGSGGGAYLDFETFNGNVYLKEKLN